MTTPYYSDERVTVLHGDCLEVLAAMPDASVDAIVTDPPYGLGFMGKAWDDLPPGLPWAVECLRVLKPGGHLLAFGGTGTTALVADVLGRHGISVDLSADYCRLSEWRTTDPGQRAKAARVEAVEPVPDGQLSLFEESA